MHAWQLLPELVRLCAGDSSRNLGMGFWTYDYHPESGIGHRQTPLSVSYNTGRRWFHVRATTTTVSSNSQVRMDLLQSAVNSTYSATVAVRMDLSAEQPAEYIRYWVNGVPHDELRTYGLKVCSSCCRLRACSCAEEHYLTR